MRKRRQHLATLLGVGCLFSAWAYWRIEQDKKFEFKAGFEKGFVGSKFDPRGYERVERISKARESDAFRARLRRGETSDLSWPGLSAAQVSWTWLELLQGLHTESSYDGDFSWMFSKLNTVIKNSPPEEQRFVTSLGSFFYVMGHDHAGATLLFQEMVKRAPDTYHTWFWGGYHAYYNLNILTLAGDCFERAAKFSFGAPYIAALAARLKLGDELMTSSERKKILEREMSPEVLEQLRISRPEWFE